MESLELRDIHLPDAVGWWPPAPGWWLVALLLPLLVWFIRYLYRRLTRKSAIKQAQIMLKNLRRQSNDSRQTLTEISAWLRRVALSTGDRATVAALRGDAWLAYLDKKLPDAPFSQGVGRCLADVHFRPELPADIDIAAVFALCERWLKAQGKAS